jgi:hypothetical protein
MGQDLRQLQSRHEQSSRESHPSDEVVAALLRRLPLRLAVVEGYWAG